MDRVKGAAEVACGEKTIPRGATESTYTPLGEVHRQAISGTIPLEFIGMKSGSYLGEDDGVRFLIRIEENSKVEFSKESV